MEARDNRRTLLPDITFEDLQKQLKELMVVDVRTREEVKEQGQLPGAHVLPGRNTRTFFPRDECLLSKQERDVHQQNYSAREQLPLIRFWMDPYFVPNYSYYSHYSQYVSF